MKPLIMFDLDGTLVDSAAGIARLASAALAAAGLEGVFRTQDVGPPFAATLARVSGRTPADPRIALAMAHFRQTYDPVCHLECRPFDGARAALAALSGAFDLGVATNKREATTHRILAEHGLDAFFGDSVFCAGDAGAPDKGRTLGRLKAARPSVFCAMVGDTIHDWHAAQAGGFDHFFLAGWGASTPLDATSAGSRDARRPRFESLTAFAGLAAAARRAAAFGG